MKCRTKEWGIERDAPSVRAALINVLLFASVLLLFQVIDQPVRATATGGIDGPELAMQMTTRDFGDVFDGEELEQNFPVANVGTKPLELRQKSTLAEGVTKQAYDLTVANWRPANAFATRPVFALRAAPS
jgi:hypothetical protein